MIQNNILKTVLTPYKEWNDLNIENTQVQVLPAYVANRCISEFGKLLSHLLDVTEKFQN